jgi:hypothetical protein
MHEQWQDKLSFYVAGSLPAAEAAALEEHLRTCKMCQQAIREWQQIAAVVRAEADMWSKQLPPLAPEVRAAVYARRAAPQGSDDLGETRPLKVVDMRRAPSRPRWAGATMLAAVITVILFGGALAVMMSRQKPNDDASFTQVAMLSEQTETVESTQTQPGATSTFRVLPTRQNNDLGIVTATPFANTALPPTVIPLPTNLPPPTDTLPIGAGGGNGSIDLSIAANPLPTSSIPDGLCAISPGTSETVPIYRAAGYENEIVGTLSPGETLVTYAQSGTGWYEVVRLGEGLLGWVPANMVVLSGSACESLMLPTPTIPTECLIRSAYGSAINLRSGPDTAFNILNAFVGTDYVSGIARSDNGWYRVRQVIDGNIWIGWVQILDVNAVGGCDLLPVILSAGYAGEIPPVQPTMMYTPTPEFPPEGSFEPTTDPSS